MADRITAKYWVGVCYPENMLDNWQDVIAEKLEVAFCYCVHDKDHLSEYNKKRMKEHIFLEEEERKTHVHTYISFLRSITQPHTTML